MASITLFHENIWECLGIIEHQYYLDHSLLLVSSEGVCWVFPTSMLLTLDLLGPPQLNKNSKSWKVAAFGDQLSEKSRAGDEATFRLHQCNV